MNTFQFFLKINITAKNYKSSDKNIYFNELSKIAKSKGGKIKEGEMYINAITKMTFIDKLGNEFKKRPKDIKNGLWSPYESENFNK